jgi:hypothetical protein
MQMATNRDGQSPRGLFKVAAAFLGACLGAIAGWIVGGPGAAGLLILDLLLGRNGWALAGIFSVAALRGLHSLKHLGIGNKVSEAGIGELRRALLQLEVERHWG